MGAKCLGYSFWVARGKLVERRVALKALGDFKHRIREITSRNGGRSLEKVAEELRTYMLGWTGYFRLADTPKIFASLDEWIARRLRMVQLKQWKQGPAFRELQRRGVAMGVAWAAAAHAQRWWRTAGHGAMNTAMPPKYLVGLGFRSWHRTDLKFPNRRMRTRISGGVGGE